MTPIEFFAQDRFAARAGIRIIDAQPGYATAEMPVSPDILNASGYVQGGALFTLADLAFAVAVNTRALPPSGEQEAGSEEYLYAPTVSVNSHIAFFRSLRAGTVHAEATVLFDHRRLPYAQVRLTDDDGNLVALFTSSGYRKSHAPKTT